MHALQVLQQRRKDVEADGHPAGEPQRAAQRPRAIGDRADRVAHVQEHPLSELHERLGRRRHPHLTPDAQEQRLAELLLEQENLPADRRLRHVQLPAARRERSGFRDGLEDLELAQVHATAVLQKCGNGDSGGHGEMQPRRHGATEDARRRARSMRVTAAGAAGRMLTTKEPAKTQALDCDRLYFRVLFRRQRPATRGGRARQSSPCRLRVPRLRGCISP